MHQLEEIYLASKLLGTLEQARPTVAVPCPPVGSLTPIGFCECARQGNVQCILSSRSVISQIMSRSNVPKPPMIRTAGLSVGPACPAMTAVGFRRLVFKLRSNNYIESHTYDGCQCQLTNSRFEYLRGLEMLWMEAETEEEHGG
jgi:hypothetical protein